MKKQKMAWALVLLGLFLLWTAVVKTLDVRPIGPLGSSVGLAALNGFVRDRIGVNMAWYTLTDWLSLVPLAFAAGFGLLGLGQWVRRRSIRRVDRSILVLGGFYGAVLGAYAMFEVLVINYRPVLIEGALEASYPSSTTMLVLCVMSTAVMELRRRIRRPALRRTVLALMAAFTVFMVIGRILSGVHWITDIVGGILLSGGLVALYDAFATE